MEASRAITRFALVELEAAGRRMRYRMQRLPAAGIFGDDTGHRTLWDELRFDIQNGPAPALEVAWDQSLRAIAFDVVERMSEHMQALLSWHLASLDTDLPDDGVNEDALIEAVCGAAREIAAW